ncbi:MAG TPA: thioredoxin domain-containing protein [Acidobacteriaceae bacterium]
MLNVLKPLRSLPFFVALAALGCHAQVLPQAAGSPVVQVGVKLSPEMARRVEVMIRSRSQVPPDYTIAISEPAKSDVQGYDLITVIFSTTGNSSRPLPFLLSTDGKTLAQFNKFDLSKDPKEIVSGTGRPARGGPENAPVLIVGFDDLECPFCAKMHAEIFPALLNRYKDKVRIVYRDFPLDQHPWAVHAAVDANCLAASSTTGYWNFVDYVHAHAAEIAGDTKSLDKAKQTLDKFTFDEGARQNLNQTDLSACVQKQDDTKVKASVQEALAEPLRVDSTPVLFINGEKVEGALPLETIYRIIDSALVAAGQTPPPPPVAPAAPAAPPAPAATKPGS